MSIRMAGIGRTLKVTAAGHRMTELLGERMDARVSWESNKSPTYAAAGSRLAVASKYTSAIFSILEDRKLTSLHSTCKTSFFLPTDQNIACVAPLKSPIFWSVCGSYNALPSEY